MKSTVTQSNFIDAFNAVCPDSFTYAGLTALYEYLIDYEDSTGEGLELDVIAFCCEYAQDEPETILEYYDLEDIEELEAHTTVIQIKGSTEIIYQQV